MGGTLQAQAEMSAEVSKSPTHTLDPSGSLPRMLSRSVAFSSIHLEHKIWSDWMRGYMRKRQAPEFQSLAKCTTYALVTDSAVVMHIPWSRPRIQF